MALKADWVDGNTYTSTAVNDVATAINVLGVVPTGVKTAGYSAAVGDLIPADATSGGFTVTLPDAPADGSRIVVKKVDSSANTVTVQRSGSDVFNVAAGATTLQLVLQDQTVAVQYQASSGIWYVTAHGAAMAATDGRYQQIDSSGVLVNPRTSALKDSNGNTILGTRVSASAVNYLQVNNQAAGDYGTPFLEAKGADTNLHIGMHPKGYGGISIYIDSPSTAAEIAVGGDEAAVDLNLKPKGTGVVKADSNPVGVKVAVPSTATSAGVVGQWAADASYLYVCTSSNVWRRVAVASW